MCLVARASGYGLDLENEIKMLRVLHRAQTAHPIDIVANYCGAHAVPRGSTAIHATRDIIERQLPAIMVIYSSLFFFLSLNVHSFCSFSDLTRAKL